MHAPTPPAIRVLIVDDEPSHQSRLLVGLQSRGFKPNLANSGAEAVALLQRYPARFDLVLVDLNLDRRDGLSTVVALRQINPALICCLITAEDVLPGNMAAGIARVFHKPFGIGELSRELMELVRGTG
jgi:DNA-binding response OmpR family regulator